MAFSPRYEAMDVSDWDDEDGQDADINQVEEIKGNANMDVKNKRVF